LNFGVLQNKPLLPFKRLEIGTPVVFAPYHVSAVALLDGRKIGTLAELPPPDPKAPACASSSHFCAGCFVYKPKCEKCAAIRNLKLKADECASPLELMDPIVMFPDHVNPPPQEG
jgi:hypothetical protein